MIFMKIMGKRKLSSFDTFSLGMVIDGAWIYDKAPEIQEMRSALAKLEQIYPILTGHYNAKTNSIDWIEGVCGVLEIDLSDLREYSKSQLINNRQLAWTLVKPFDIKGYKKGRVCGFRATLGMLSDGAILYVQVAHAIMDGSCFYTLMKQWAALYKGESISEMKQNQSLLPTGDYYSKAETIEKVTHEGWPTISLGKAFKMILNLIKSSSIKDCFTIEVSQEELSELKKQSGAGTHAILSAIAAHAMMSKPEGGKRLKLLSVVDLRGHFPMIDASFMGNFSQPVMASGEYSLSSDIPSMARQMDADFKSVLLSEIPEKMVRLSICASYHKLKYFYFDPSQMNCKNPSILYVNNQLKFRPCELDWGAGAPLYAFHNGLSDMVKFWQSVPGGPIQIIFAGISAKIMTE